jgi:hypothetical protein
MADGTFERIRERAHQDTAFRRRLLATPLAALREYDLTDEARRQLVIPNFCWVVDRVLAGSSRPRTADALT